MTVTVAIPWYGRPDLLTHCVETVLAQTYRDLHVVVVGDGVEPPLRMRDDRLDVWHIPKNRGTYFVRQLILLASPHEWHAPVDADDCLGPTHIETMMAQLQDCSMVAPNRLCVHGNGKCEHRGGVGSVQGKGRFHVGLFARERMLSIGGYDPAERIGGDTMLLRLLRLCYPDDIRTVDDPAYLEAPTYHRIRRPDSLTRAPATSLKSLARRAMKARNRRVYSACASLHRPERIRAWRGRQVPPDIAADLAACVEALTGRLGKAA